MITGMMARRIMVAGDNYSANVVALLHMNGSNGSTTFTDETGRTWTASGNAQIVTDAGMFGGACGTFDGTNDWIETADSDDFAFGSGNFTIEASVKVPDVVGTHAIIGQWAGSSRSWLLYLSESRVTFVFSINGSTNNFVESAASTITANTKYHIAVCREGTSINIFIDGIYSATTASIWTNSLFNSTNTVRIGADSSGSNDMLGLIDEVRVTKGVCRYPVASAPFTPPSEEFVYP